MNAISEKSRVVLRDAQFRPGREGGFGGGAAGGVRGVVGVLCQRYALWVCTKNNCEIGGRTVLSDPF